MLPARQLLIVSYGPRCVQRLSSLELFVFGAARHVSTHDSSGPPPGVVSAVPFQVEREAAAAAFQEYHKGHFFSTKPSSGLQKIKEAFLPFWVSEARAGVQLHGAQLGFDQWVQRYNPNTRRPEMRLETVWQWADLRRASWEQPYHAGDAGMQVYASYKYPRSEVNGLRPLGAVKAAAPFSSEMVVSSFDGATRRVGPFQMKPAVATRFVREWIEAEETARAKAFVKSAYRCDRVGQLSMDVRLHGLRSSPVYVPVFVFRSTHFGSKLRTFVSGVTPQMVVGSRPLDETKVGAVGGLAGLAAVLLTGAYASLSPWEIWVWGVALPATALGSAAHFYTQARGRWNAYWQRSEQERQEAANQESPWDPAWVRAYARLEEESRQREERESPASRLFGGRFSRRDPKYAPGLRHAAATAHEGLLDLFKRQIWSRGYYGIMGVEPSASKQEIQAAYRGLVMKHHPDRVQEAEKQQALKKFQAVQEAYAVLRDAAKRKQYDAS